MQIHVKFSKYRGETGKQGAKTYVDLSYSLLEKMLINIGFSQKGDAYQSTTYSGEEECE